jgi:NAD(P)-dependent dehydrogenase (short-subunit alcohol dehydrogenase family)
MHAVGELDGRVALVIGGTAGIGLGVARRLADDGATVVITGRRADLGASIADESAGRISFVRMDVQELDEVRDGIEQTLHAHRRLDVLVNNAGDLVTKSVLDTTPDELDRVYRGGLRYVFFAIQWAAAHMVERGEGGSIVNICSIGATRGFADRAAYCAIKGAELQLSRAAALDLAPSQVRVNAVSPGAMDTDMLREALFGDDPDVDERMAERGKQLVPLGRMGVPGDVADAVSFLASDRARWITGTNLVVDGGVLSA